MFDALRRFAAVPALGATLMAVTLLGAPAVHAQSAIEVLAAAGVPVAVEPVTVKLAAFKVVRDAKGKETFVAADKAKPGDTLEYRARYSNISKQSVEGVQAVLPIPVGTRYLGDSAVPVQFQARATGQTDFAAAPLKKSVTDAQGVVSQTGIAYSEYRELRWNLGQLKPDSSKVVIARVVVNTGSDKTPKPDAEKKQEVR